MGDYLEILPSLSADVIFLSPPWVMITLSFLSVFSYQKQGGPDYKYEKEFNLSSIRLKGGVDGFDLFYRTFQKTNNVAYYLPRNTNHDQIKNIALEGEKRCGRGGTIICCEVEEEIIGQRTKAITAYFGDLVVQ